MTHSQCSSRASLQPAPATSTRLRPPPPSAEQRQSTRSNTYKLKLHTSFIIKNNKVLRKFYNNTHTHNHTRTHTHIDIINEGTYSAVFEFKDCYELTIDTIKTLMKIFAIFDCSGADYYCICHAAIVDCT